MAYKFMNIFAGKKEQFTISLKNSPIEKFTVIPNSEEKDNIDGFVIRNTVLFKHLKNTFEEKNSKEAIGLEEFHELVKNIKIKEDGYIEFTYKID